MSGEMLSGPQRRSKRTLLHYIIGFGVPVFLILYCCSGWQWPMWNARGKLGEHLANEFGIQLPASATVVHAVRVAMRDSSEYYELNLALNDVAAFYDACKKVAEKDEDVDPKEYWGIGPTPDWWKPVDLKLTRRLDLSHHLQSGVVVYLAPASSKLLVCWFEY